MTEKQSGKKEETKNSTQKRSKERTENHPQRKFQKKEKRKERKTKEKGDREKQKKSQPRLAPPRLTTTVLPTFIKMLESLLPPRSKSLPLLQVLQQAATYSTTTGSPQRANQLPHLHGIGNQRPSYNSQNWSNHHCSWHLTEPWPPSSVKPVIITNKLTVWLVVNCSLDKTIILFWFPFYSIFLLLVNLYVFKLGQKRRKKEEKQKVRKRKQRKKKKRENCSVLVLSPLFMFSCVVRSKNRRLCIKNPMMFTQKSLRFRRVIYFWIIT